MIDGEEQEEEQVERDAMAADGEGDEEEKSMASDPGAEDRGHLERDEQEEE
jgi:hypothetical protein